MKIGCRFQMKSRARAKGFRRARARCAYSRWLKVHTIHVWQEANIRPGIHCQNMCVGPCYSRFRSCRGLHGQRSDILPLPPDDVQMGTNKKIKKAKMNFSRKKEKKIFLCSFSHLGRIWKRRFVTRAHLTLQIQPLMFCTSSTYP